MVVSALAFSGLAYAWQIEGPGRISWQSVVLALLLLAAVAAAYRFPIHINRSQKVEMTSVPLYLMAVLLPSVPLAATAAGAGILLGEMLVRRERGNLYSDLFTAVSRWTIVVMAGAASVLLLGEGAAISFVGAALVMWLGDWITCPLVVAPMNGDRPLQVMLGNARDTALVEGSQYLIALLGALAAGAHLWALGLLLVPTMLVYRAFKSAKEMQYSTFIMLESMADAVDLRDPYTGGHSLRVAALTSGILSELGMRGPEAELIVTAARIHDIGKIGLPDSILNKTGKLTSEEIAIMQTHPDLGADLLHRHSDLMRGADTVRHHHERWDGAGYPQRLKGTNIPFGARVIAVADSYDAMTTDRPYRQAMTREKATAVLQEGRGSQWDPDVVDAFLKTVAHPAGQPDVASPDEVRRTPEGSVAVPA